MTNHHGARSLSPVLVFLLLGVTAAWLLLLPAARPADAARPAGAAAPAP